MNTLLFFQVILVSFGALCFAEGIVSLSWKFLTASIILLALFFAISF